jgi:hypothetical protein
MIATHSYTDNCIINVLLKHYCAEENFCVSQRILEIMRKM